LTETVAQLVELQNVTWLLLCSGLVLLMQAGFCFLEAGMVRSKNSINVAVKNISDFCISSVLYWVVGFAVMFSNNGSLINMDYLFFSQMDSPQLISFFIFQAVFCGTAATILSGGIAERATFIGYLLIAAITALIIHPVFGRLAWNGLFEGEATGWLNSRGFIDFSGSSVVHSTGGWIALAAIIIIGPRIGRFKKGLPPIQGHNIPMATVGVIILWFGWMGFNGGSLINVDVSIAKIILNTNIAAASAGIMTLLISWALHKKPNVGHILNGVLAGLVSITACCHAVVPYEASLIGLLGACIYFLSFRCMERLKLDDAIGVVPVHAMCGVWGTLCVAFFADPKILATGLNFVDQLEIQIVGILICFLWGFGSAFILLFLLNKIIPLRVSYESEVEGLNVSEHNANTEVLDLLYAMEKQKLNRDFSQKVFAEPNTEVGQIANSYNRILEKVNEEIGLKDKKNYELELSYKQLKEAQELLVKAEKMAALGGLVSGIAHEINTPVGICITAETFLSEKTELFSKMYKLGEISRKDFENYLEYYQEASELISSNLQRAALLIENFKLIDSKYKNEEKCSVKLVDYINGIATNYLVRLKEQQIDVTVNGDEDIDIITYPDAIFKVINNVLDNSIVHGLESFSYGEVQVNIFRKNQDTYIDIKDSGRGMADDDINKIFDPFYTTKRGQGSSGLGMYIVYNLVTQTLKGTIECSNDCTGGMRTVIILPSGED